MAATSLLSRTFSVAFVVLLLLPASWAQRNASKNTKIDITTIPTMPESIVDKVAFVVHADPNFFTLDDFRRFGGDLKIKVD
ncbi:MAG: hypothetical protein VXZ28_00445 [Bacteroidota bacterium]|nr:hypothetical protein [Bacteroidota bacterium]